MTARITPALIADIVQTIPAAWLTVEPGFANEGEHRAAYTNALTRRLRSPRAFVEEAIRARAVHV